MIVHTKLWVDVQQWEDEGEFLIFLHSDESYEAENVVEQEWSQHGCRHFWVRGETTGIGIGIRTVGSWIPFTLIKITTIMTLIPITVVSSPVQFVDQIDVSESVQGWQSDVED